MHGAHRLFLLALAWALPGLSQEPFAWKDVGDGRLELRERGQLALVYNYGPQHRAGVPEDRRRCCYIFPLFTPGGVSMLDDFPRDHLHHRGLFWSWPVIETGGKKYDNWMAFTAKHRAARTPVTKGDTLETENFWQAGGRDVVRENLRLTVLPASGAVRELDIQLTWEALGEAVTLRGSAERGKSYGGLSTRFAPREGTILRADGEVLTKDEDLNPRQWAELEAVYGGKRAVLRITPDSKNPGVPYQWCLRAYGFVGASFPGRTATVGGYTLEPGKPLTLRFRVRVGDVLAPPVPMTAQEDHRRLLDLLNITSLRPGANGRDPQAPHAANYDESKANPYPSLPDPLLLKSGKKVSSAGVGPVYRLLGKRYLGTAEFPPMETALIDGEAAFRQHSGGHTPTPNWPTFLAFAGRFLKAR